MAIEWDPAKDRANRRKHGISFKEASELFESGVEYLEVYDIEHSDTEDRFIAIGPIRRGMILVAWTERIEDTIRLISARWATEAEAKMYQEYIGGDDDR